MDEQILHSRAFGRSRENSVGPRVRVPRSLRSAVRAAVLSGKQNGEVVEGVHKRRASGWKN